ncbi:MAG TPA: sugar transferase [Roseiflexaceae bacterium]|nr:sugar transferase [Roseiflexaceae bacterium]
MIQDLTTSDRARNAGPWYLTMDPQNRIIRGKPYHFLKRAMDITACLLVAPLVVPLLLIVAVLVYIDSPGKVMFTQLRTGKGGRRFKMYKFRSMVPNAEELKIKYAHLNELTWPDFKITNDPRITRVGKILRKTSLDELPQLLNVLKGDMSLVGPRPTSFAPETYRLWHTERLEVVPGITGLWQISGRSNLDFDQRLKLDIAYIERQSIWMDICIIARTVGQVFIGDGAY